MKRVAQAVERALVGALVLALIATAGWSQSLTWLGTLGGIRAGFGVSADGAVVVGWAENAAGFYRAFRWTSSGGMQDLGTLGGGGSWANGVSADGAVVVGGSYNAARQWRAFRWTASGGMQDLGTLPGYDRSYASDVSADGAVVVGGLTTPQGMVAPFAGRLLAGMQDLGTLGGNWSEAMGRFRRRRRGGRLRYQRLRADGVPFAGRRWVGCKTSARCRDTIGAMQLLFPPTVPWWSAGLKTPQGMGVPFAGRLLVACKTSARWAAMGSWAWGVSADGSVVVGDSLNDDEGFRAFRWTTSGGMEDLNATYARLLTPGSYLETAYAVSSDGRYIVGVGYNADTELYEAFLLDTRCTSHNGDVNNSRCVDDADLLAVLFAFGNTGSNLGRVDVNCDGRVDDADLLQVLFNFGSGC
jgi:probable HAF family extracellular repeat protein